jgi:hypothetical protein
MAIYILFKVQRFIQGSQNIDGGGGEEKSVIPYFLF